MIYPPLVSYDKLEGDDVANSQPAASPPATGSAGKPASTIAKAKAAKSSGGDSNGVFAYLLIGMSAMFLLFLGSTAMTDLHRELRQRTFERYQTMRQQLWPFIVGKVVFAVVILLICSAVMLGGGGLIFRIQWRQPAQLIMLAFGYACFVAALFAVLVALVPDERRAGVLNNLAGMALGFVGGCVFPPEHLPAFLRECVTPLMPSHWFAETARNLQFDGGSAAWKAVFLKLAVISVILVALTTVLFRRRFKTGHRE
jgi:ABC-2 type transport system permease protein